MSEDAKWDEIEARAARMRATLIVDGLLASGERRVRTSAGVKKFNQPMGTVIRRDALPGDMRRSLRVFQQSGKKKSPVVKGQMPTGDSSVVQAYSHNSRLPDGRVILTEKQLSEFVAKTAPHSMLAFVQDAVDPQGNPVKVLTKEREALHNRLVTEALRGVRPNSSGRKIAIFLGGGTGAGKSSVTDLLPGFPKMQSSKDKVGPFDAVKIDADGFKVLLPEWGSLGPAKDAGFTHEESSLLAGLTMEAAFDRGLDTVIDGTGDGNPVKMRGKIDHAKAAGYQTQAEYVTVPAGEAVVRSVARGLETHRDVKLSTALAIHRGVTTTVEAVQNDYDSFDLYDTDTALGAPPIPIVKDGKIVDPERWAAFIGKKSVPDLQAYQEALRKAEAKVFKPIKEPGTGRVLMSPEEVKGRVIDRIKEEIQAEIQMLRLESVARSESVR